MVRFDNYIVLRKAGAGGLADVYLAEVPMDDASPREPLLPGDRVALKVLRDPGRSEASRRRFLREGYLLQRLVHPGLPRCYEVVDGERPYIVLEFLEGRSLKEAIRGDGPLDHHITLSVADAVLRALVYLHANAIVHRDVKPGNVFLTQDERVILLDLGLAADPTAPLDTTVGDVMGTYAYMAPEQIAGAALDHRADLYSLGITLYEAVAGRRPYKARGPTGYLRAHTRGNAQPLSELRKDRIPPRLDELVGRLMARDPAARPQSATLAVALLTGHQSARRELLSPPMVGRSAAIGAIEAVLDGGGRLQLIGEPGMGTGRLTRYAFAEARNREMEVLTVRCRGGRDPLEPLDALRRAVSRVLGPIPDDLTSTRMAIADFAAEGTILLIVEDARTSSPALLDALGPILSVPNVCVLITADRAVEELGGHVLELRPLERGEVHDLIAGMLGTSAPPAGLPDKLFRFTGGLPAAVAFTVRDFFEKGALQCTGIGDEGDTTWKLTSSMRMTTQNSLTYLFNERLDGLDPGERRLLHLLAVAREELPLDLAASVARLDRGSLAPERLISMRLATARVDAEGSWIGITRPALASLVTTSLSVDHVRACNAALARAMTEMPASSWRDDRLPFFRAFGASSEQAARAQVRIGEWLEDRGRHAQALEVLTRANHEPGLGTEEATRCALARGRALLGLSRSTEAIEALSAAKRLAKDLDRDDLHARALVGLAESRTHHGEVRRAADLAEEALVRLEGRAPNLAMARAQLIRGRGLAILGDIEQAVSCYRACLEIAHELRAKELVASAHGAIALVYAHAGRLGDGIRYLNLQASWLRAHQRRDGLVQALFHLGRLHLRAGDVDAATEAIDEAEHGARETGLSHLAALAGIGRAELRMAIGDPKGANELLRKHWFAGESDASVFVRAYWLSARVAVRMAFRDGNAALATCNQLVEETARVGWESMRAYHAGLIAVMRAHGDDIAEAIDSLNAIGDRQGCARLLLAGARMGGGAEVLDAAAKEARAAADAFLLLDVLYTAGGAVQRHEAHDLVRGILARASGEAARLLRRREQVRWALEES